jgi:hypothetical protein
MIAPIGIAPVGAFLIQPIADPDPVWWFSNPVINCLNHKEKIMEVTHVRDRVTHAVIGGMAAESFGISDDPAFFHVLSSTLYRDKLRAVIRETLCNAWDAHVEAGLESVPIEVTLTNEKLTIQDFGLGIDPSQIKPIYGVYGQSTKKKNKLVTGGFGLGCKAPFAYVDHFEVISCHQGEKTVYRMSKSSGEVMGKPSIQPMVANLPTDESGITVSMAVKGAGDYSRFRTLIEQIAKLGEMKVKFNGELIEVAPFHAAKHGYLILKSDDFGAGAEHPLQLRYGHVVYPIEVHDEYIQEYNKARKFLESISTKRSYYDRSGNLGWVLILQAPADTISVTPSRESLSMTDHTVKTVKGLLDQFISNTRSVRLESICLDLVEKAVETTWLMDTPANLLDSAESTPNSRAIELFTSPYITDVVDVGGHYLRNSYPTFRHFHNKDMMMRLDALAMSGFGNRGLIQSFRKQFRKVTKGNFNHGLRASGQKWWLRRRVWPLYRAIAANKLLDKKRLFIWSEVYTRRGNREYGTIPVHSWEPTLAQCLPFLRNIMIVGYNRRDIEDRVHKFPAMKHWFGHHKNNLCYLVPRNPERAKAAIETFQKLGFYVIDLTVAQSWEWQDIIKPVPKAAPQKKRAKGFPVLANLTASCDVKLLYAEGAPRSEIPQFHVYVSPKAQTLKLGGFNTDANFHLVRLFGKDGVAIRTSTQAPPLVAKGSRDFDSYVRGKLLDYYKNEPLVKQWHMMTAMEDGNIYDHDVLDALNYDDKRLITAIQEDGVLRDKFGFLKPVPENIQDIVAVLRSVRSPWEFRQYPEYGEIKKLVESWGPAPELITLIKMIRDSKLIRIIDKGGIRLLLSGGTATPAQKTQARDILLTALKG